MVWLFCDFAYLVVCWLFCWFVIWCLVGCCGLGVVAWIFVLFEWLWPCGLRLFALLFCLCCLLLFGLLVRCFGVYFVGYLLTFVFVI